MIKQRRKQTLMDSLMREGWQVVDLVAAKKKYNLVRYKGLLAYFRISWLRIKNTANQYKGCSSNSVHEPPRLVFKKVGKREIQIWGPANPVQAPYAPPVLLGHMDERAVEIFWKWHTAKRFKNPLLDFTLGRVRSTSAWVTAMLTRSDDEDYVYGEEHTYGNDGRVRSVRVFFQTGGRAGIASAMEGLQQAAQDFGAVAAGTPEPSRPPRGEGPSLAEKLRLASDRIRAKRSGTACS